MTIKTENIELFSKAVQARENASARYSNFKVGAAIRTVQGKIYTGSNVESSSYGLSMCAERVALFTALNNGERDFDRILIVSDSKDTTSPCGACRQLLYDYSPDIKVVMTNLKRDEQISSIKELLKKPFSLDN